MCSNNTDRHSQRRSFTHPEVRVGPSRRATKQKEAKALVFGLQEEPTEEVGVAGHDDELAEKTNCWTNRSLVGMSCYTAAGFLVWK